MGVEYAQEGEGFGFVAHTSGSGVGVDVVDV